MMFYRLPIPIVTFLTLSLLPLLGCGRHGYATTNGMIWNTTYNITYNGSEELADSILIVLDQVGKSLNVFDPNSLVSKVNNNDSVEIDSHFKKVYTTSTAINKVSSGLFDPTVAPLVKAWGFGPVHSETRDTLAIDSILSFTGICKTDLIGNIIVKEDIRTEFNFSAVAKGYGCDAVAEMLKRNGVNDYLVEIGGELALGGKSPSGTNWRVSIDTPSRQLNCVVHDSFTIIETSDVGIATSGNYRNFKIKDRKAIGHTISPITGRPVETDVISATVIANTAMEADAIATACMAMGSETATNMLNFLKVDAMLILSDSSYISTPGFRKLENKQ